MQTATAYSTFLRNTPVSATDAAGNFDDNDDQADSGSALEDSPRDASGDDDDDEDYQQDVGGHEHGDDAEQDDDYNRGAASGGHMDGQVEGAHQQTSGGPYPQAYTLAYTQAAQDYINPYFYTPPQHNPYSVTGGQGEYYPTAMAQNPVPVPAIALPAPHTEGVVAANLSSVAGPSAPPSLHYQSVRDLSN